MWFSSTHAPVQVWVLAEITWLPPSKIICDDLNINVSTENDIVLELYTFNHNSLHLFLLLIFCTECNKFYKNILSEKKP